MGSSRIEALWRLPIGDTQGLPLIMFQYFGADGRGLAPYVELHVELCDKASRIDRLARKDRALSGELIVKAFRPGQGQYLQV